MATSDSPLNVPDVTLAVARGAASGGGDASLVYALEFENGEPRYQSGSDPHPGGGWGSFAANNGDDGPGAGINGTNITVVDISDDPLFGTVKGLRDTYLEDLFRHNVSNQSIYLRHQELPKFYMRMRIRWSPNWEWGSDQLKFCKNTAETNPKLSTNCPKFGGEYMYITKLAPTSPSSNEQNVFAVNTGFSSDFRIEDDIVNNFGGDGVDANWTPVLGQWYWLEWEIDAGTPGQANGHQKIWIDGQLYMSIENVQIAEEGDNLFDKHELGHVWQGDTLPTEDIYMEWHSIEIWDQKPAGGL